MKEVKISFRITKEELEILDEEMKAYYPIIEGKRSTYIREKVLHGELPPTIRQDVRDIQYQVNKIGVNVNQIAKKMNAGYVYNTDADHVMDGIQKVEEQIEKLMKILEGKRNGNH